MKVDPVITFWLGVITTVMQGIATGTVHLTGIVPEASIPAVTGWLSLIVFVNMTFLTALSGFSSSRSGPLAPAPTVADAQQVMHEATKAK